MDTAPLLERTYARLAGLGWIGRNTCLINQQQGSWFFLGELLVSLEIAPDAPPPDRCGTCMRCIDACPTAAIVPGRRALDATPVHLLLHHRAARRDSGRAPRRNGRARVRLRHLPGRLPVEPPRAGDGRAGLRAAPFRARAWRNWRRSAEDEFRAMFRGTPVTRARYSGFLRNVAVAMGNAGARKFRAPLEKLAASPDAAGRRSTPAGRLAATRISASSLDIVLCPQRIIRVDA